MLFRLLQLFLVTYLTVLKYLVFAFFERDFCLCGLGLLVLNSEFTHFMQDCVIFIHITCYVSEIFIVVVTSCLLLSVTWFSLFWVKGINMSFHLKFIIQHFLLCLEGFPFAFRYLPSILTAVLRHPQTLDNSRFSCVLK